MSSFIHLFHVRSMAKRTSVLITFAIQYHWWDIRTTLDRLPIFFQDPNVLHERYKKVLEHRKWKGSWAWRVKVSQSTVSVFRDQFRTRPLKILSSICSIRGQRNSLIFHKTGFYHLHLFCSDLFPCSAPFIINRMRSETAGLFLPSYCLLRVHM